MKAIVIIAKNKDGFFEVYTKDLKTSLWGEGATVVKAKAMMEASYSEIIQFYKEDGIALPAELVDLEFEYKYDLSSLFDYYDFINVSKFAEYAGINASLMRKYKLGKTYISEQQSQRIEQAIRVIGQEFSAINLV